MIAAQDFPTTRRSPNSMSPSSSGPNLTHDQRAAELQIGVVVRDQTSRRPELVRPPKEARRRDQTCTHCNGDGYIETQCACDWPTCRICDGTGHIGGVA